LTLEISKNLEKIPETNIIIFNSINPDKRKKFFKELLNKSDKIEKFFTENEKDLFQLINKKFKNKISNV
jgi:hypothetical protein